jgi:sugar lactone lactonase YvrE
MTRHAVSRSRYEGPEPHAVAPWSLRRLTQPAALYGSNGILEGPDGWLYVAELLGNRISAIDRESGEREVVVPLGGPVAAPDDIAFGPRGTLYVADNMPGRVWAREQDGELRLLADGIPAANGIATAGERLFVNECRPGGRLLELFPAGGEPRVVLSDLMTPNAMALGPDGLLYYPLVMLGEIWRTDLEGERPERVAAGLAVPTAVKFDRRGGLTTTCGLTGEIVDIDVRSGVLAVRARVAPGLDNLAFDGDDRLYVTRFLDGSVTEILSDGGERSVVAPGLTGPAGLAVAEDGALLAADGPSLAGVEDGVLRRIATLLDHGFPGVVRGLAAGPGATLYASTSGGTLAAYEPGGEARILASGLREPIGVAAAGGAVYVADAGAGTLLRVRAGADPETLADGLERPSGVAVTRSGAIYVAEAGAGRVLRLAGSDAEVVADGLAEPHGLAAHGDAVYVLDALAKRLLEIGGGVIAQDLPVGAPAGRALTPLCGVELMPGPLTPFAGLAAGPGGTLYVAADGEGSVLALERPPL